MDAILSTIYLKVKSETRTLAKSAIAQILVKIIYSDENRLSFDDILRLYKTFTNRKQVDENVISEVLADLCDNNEIKLSAKNEYYITASKRKRIGDACEDSNRRRGYIIDNYFSKVHSDRTSIEKWLQDVSMHFFKFFSDEWISDLLKTKDAIIYSQDSIREMIKKRTLNNKEIEKKDYVILPGLFFDFLCSKDPDVAAYLWEYGTSAFSAKLISNTVGIDKLTLDIFKGSKCLLDTNILIFIKLESSKFHEALVSLENSFLNLGVEIGVLYITKEEFQHKIDYQKQLTINNIEKMGCSLVSEANDDFTRSAISLCCRKKEDFITYFESLRELPEYLNANLPIKLIDDNEQLIKSIEMAQRTEEKKTYLNSIFVTATGREKNSLLLPMMLD